MSAKKISLYGKIALLILLIFLIDLLRFWGGYNGVLRVVPLAFARMLCAGLAFIFLFGRLRMLMKKRQILPALVPMALALILPCYLSFVRAERDPFVLGAQTRLFKSIDPNRVQEWAQSEMANRTDNEDIFIPTEELPEFVKISHWPQLGAYIRNRGSIRHVDLVWGSGMAGVYGIKVGSPEFVSTGDKVWRPGIYFYTAP